MINILERSKETDLIYWNKEYGIKVKNLITN